MEEYFYKVYGLTVFSEIMLNELVEIDKDNIGNIRNEIDVNIKYNDMPKNITESINKRKLYYYSFDESWFYIPYIAVYRVCNGREIYIKHMGGKIQEIKTYLLGGAFMCLLFQRKTIAVHGGSILTNSGGIIITGRCGAGKSTLTSAFINRGYKYLSDDLSVVEINSDSKLEIKPAYPQQKLCRDAAVKLGYNINKLVRIDDRRDKFAVAARKEFVNLPKKLAAIFEISVDKRIKEIKIEEVKGIDKLNSIIDNLYESDVAKAYGVGPFMNIILDIAKNIPYYKLTRPKDLFTVNEQIRLITSRI
jgi:hypothetical protein